jgi:hypothetical protein
MKILYVKSNNQRSKFYQLRTILYEKNGIKYIKKEAIRNEAIPHLKKMKDSYRLLNSQIKNSNIKLAKIIDETENSLTFEFIEGISAENLFIDAVNNGREDEFLLEYRNKFKQGFNSKVNNIESEVEISKLFGNINILNLNKRANFNIFANIDFIFSNIIYQNDTMYIIDYEWVYECLVPFDFILFRAITYSNTKYSMIIDANTLEVYKSMEKHFQKNVVNDNEAFATISHRYQKDKVTNILILKIMKLLFRIRSKLKVIYYFFIKK